jgi:sigma-E factor negative regulatory protein RseB
MLKTRNVILLIRPWLYAALAISVPATAWAQQLTPGDWLERMESAVRSTSYHGTVIRHQRGESEALKVVHKIVDGVVNERVTSQEGYGLEIIRIGDDVHCILPEKQSVLVEGWNNQSALFSPLPQATVIEMPQYDLSIMREGRVAGRPAVLLAIRPHDSYRYAHRIWLDKASGFPLQTEIHASDGELIEEVKFADITISDNISADALDPSINLDGFTWYKEPSRYPVTDVDTEWVCDDLPAGFRAVSTKTEKTSSSDESGPGTTHIVYSDGIANVSVFIEPAGGEDRSGWAILGSSNSFSTDEGDHQITVVGEVPGITLQRIASSMRVK